MKNSISRLLLFIGVLCFLCSIFFFLQRYQPISSRSHIFSKKQMMPIGLTITRLHIAIGVVPSHMKDNQWQTTNNGVSYLVSSPLPGMPGNSIMYGHDFPTILGSLPDIKPGDRIQIRFSNGSLRIFTVAYTSIVSPDEISILAPSRDTRVTLYTCTGFLETKRFVAVALASN